MAAPEVPDTTLPASIDISAEAWLTVPFHDADPAGVAWHGNYLKYFDAARCALLDRIAYSYRQMGDSGLFWPIVHVQIKYLRPLPYDSRIRVVACLVEWEYRLKIAYEVYDADGRKATTGHTVQVPVSASSGEMLIGAPEPLRSRLETFLRESAAP